MKRRSSVALIASVAALAVILPACGSEEASVPPAQSVATETSPSGDLAPDAGPTTEGEAACVPRGHGHERICALAPPHRRVQGGSAYCDGFRRCEPAVVNREAVPAGVLTRWDDASGMISDLGVTTVDLGPWTLVLPELDAGPAERVARGLSWSVGEDGYPRLASTDPEVPVDADWADVVLWVPNLGTEGKHHFIRVIPGCELSVKEPGLGGSDAAPDLQLLDVVEDPPDTPEPDTVEGGRWCVDGRYWVEVTFTERPRLELFHAKLRVVASAG
jgi:hypothetical protein